uniref:Uncharacterized protein n=1 Tax=Anas platyrhynchos platyrhynchos TaxID=8840 RepID=A0A493T7G2_ANAPP
MGTEVDGADAEGCTALHAALSVAALWVPGSRGCSELVELLLEHAAYKNHTRMVELLLEASAQVDEVNVAGHTALLEAATMGHRAVVSALLFWGAAVDRVDPEGWTAQAVAAVQGSTAMAQALLAWGLDEKHSKLSILFFTEPRTCGREGGRESQPAPGRCVLFIYKRI